MRTRPLISSTILITYIWRARTNQLLDRHVKKFDPRAASLQRIQKVVSPFEENLVELGWIRTYDEESDDEVVEPCFASAFISAFAEAEHL